MITYNPQDPTTEVVFNGDGLVYEYRGLPDPDTDFILGEWVGLGANKQAVKLATGVAIDNPGVVFTEKGRRDVQESEGLTILRGFFHLSTENYATSEGFAVGDEVIVGTDTAKGVLKKLPTSGGTTHWVVGTVFKAPAVDGTDRLIVSCYPQPIVRVAPA